MNRILISSCRHLSRNILLRPATRNFAVATLPTISHSMQTQFGVEDATYKAIGEHEGLVRLVDSFYAAMDSRPEAEKVRGMHRRNLTMPKDKLVHFLSGWMGGPRIYGPKYGSICIPEWHSHLKIDAADRDAWLGCMQVALIELQYPEDLQQYLMAQLFRPAERIRQVSQARHNPPDSV
jgi:hemoglobin